MIIELANCKKSKSRALYCTTNSLSGPLIVSCRSGTFEGGCGSCCTKYSRFGGGLALKRHKRLPYFNKTA